MTERLSDIQARIGTVHQLSAVITAMRGVAAARAREARAQVDGIRTYAAAIAHAIGQALVFLPEADRTDPARNAGGGHAIVALCAEQGFAGVFSERVLDAAVRLARSEAPGRTELLLVGDRGLIVAAERDIAVGWSAAMIAHTGQIASLASRIVEALYERLDAGTAAQVTIVHAVPDGSAILQIAQKRLMPFDFARFPMVPNAMPPLLTLPPQLLLSRLAEEYVFAELCEALMLSFAAENEARMRAMIAARSNVANTLDGLVARSRQLRQEEITSEIIELAAGAGVRRTHG
jgi:F-type H+-transporting ATPase subunit gamma